MSHNSSISLSFHFVLVCKRSKKNGYSFERYKFINNIHLNNSHISAHTRQITMSVIMNLNSTQSNHSNVFRFFSFHLFGFFFALLFAFVFISFAFVLMPWHRRIYQTMEIPIKILGFFYNFSWHYLCQIELTYEIFKFDFMNEFFSTI